MLLYRVPELIFWHIPSKAYKKVAPKFRIRKPCVGSINKEKVAAQEAEMGIMKILVKRPSVKVISWIHMLSFLESYKYCLLNYSLGLGVTNF